MEEDQKIFISGGKRMKIYSIVKSIRCEVPQSLFPMSILTAYKFTELYGFWIWLIPVCIFLFIPFLIIFTVYLNNDLN